MLDYPIHFKRQGAQLPDLVHDQARYVVAQNGKFIERNTAMYQTSVSLTAFDLDLEPSQEYCYLRYGRMPAVMHRAMLSFFLHAHRLHRGEAALVLLYHLQRRRFSWYCPDQYVDVKATKLGWLTIDQIEFENPWILPDGYRRVGDAHLHPASPHPSAQDMSDDEDGLHIIVGNIQTTPEYHIDFVMDRRRFRLRPEQFFEQPDCEPFRQPPHDWMKRIHIRKLGETR